MIQDIRPKTLAHYIGQEMMVNRLAIFIQAAQLRQEPLDHVLLYGPPGLGKTTLAHIIAIEMGASLKITTGPALEKTGDLAAMLTSLKKLDILFVDEIHRLSPVVEELLYSAMEDYTLDLMMGEGPGARSVRLKLEPFTLIGATTRAGALSAPLRDRFGIIERLHPYTEDAITTIVQRSATILNITMTTEGAQVLAKASRGIPRLANRLLRRVRDIAQTAHIPIDHAVAQQALQALHIQPCGLDDMDLRYLQTLHTVFHGGPAGLDNLAAAMNESQRTLSDMVEPFLIQKGWIMRVARGRMLTSLGWQMLATFDRDNTTLLI
jgi:holliday junction DNA helicase RuvB